MTSTTWMHAPAGVLGQGFADARPAGAAIAPIAGRGVAPTALLAAAVRPGIAVPPNGVLPGSRLRSAGLGVGFGPDLSGTAVVDVPCTPRGEYTAQHDGTTLGFHPSSRSVS